MDDLVIPELKMTLLHVRNDESNDSASEVVKIVLFSVTGLFVAVLVVLAIIGTIRVYRHPERYIRRDDAGQPIRSRAKGITHAILDTIPVIKFAGDAKPSSQTDVELQASEELGPKIGKHDEEGITIEVVETNDDSTNPPPLVPPKADCDPPGDKVNCSSCSICTEYFDLGESVRVLPCGHKYHPSCIDPWLLGRSTTCPLCRVDLDSKNQQSGAASNSGNRI